MLLPSLYKKFLLYNIGKILHQNMKEKGNQKWKINPSNLFDYIFFVNNFYLHLNSTKLNKSKQGNRQFYFIQRFNPLYESCILSPQDIHVVGSPDGC